MIKHMERHQDNSMQHKKCDEIFTCLKDNLELFIKPSQVEPDASIIQSIVIVPQQLGTYTLNISEKITEIDIEPKQL